MVFTKNVTDNVTISCYNQVVKSKKELNLTLI